MDRELGLALIFRMNLRLTIQPLEEETVGCWYLGFYTIIR